MDSVISQRMKWRCTQLRTGDAPIERAFGKRPSLLIACFVLTLAFAFVSLCAFGVEQADAAAPQHDAYQAGSLHTVSKAANCKRKASSITLFKYGWHANSNHSATHATKSSYDVTGDAKADTVSIKMISTDSDGALASKLQVKVNGSLAYSISAEAEIIDNASVSVVTLKNNKPFLFISVFQTDGNAHQGLYAWRDGQFTKIVGNDLLSREGTSNPFMSSLTPIGNRIIAQFEFVSSITGHTRTSFSYVWKDNALHRLNDTTNALRFSTPSAGAITATSTGAYAKQFRATTQKLTAFSSVSLRTSSFTVPAGKMVRPVALSLQGDSLLYKIQYGSKFGWIKCEAAKSYKGGRLLKGTYGTTPLSSRVPAYTKSKKLSVSSLQKHDNHALFLARNEVFARHGYMFSTPELKRYFESKSWYKPKQNANVKFNKIESKNIELILAIEKNRNSPYVS